MCRVIKKVWDYLTIPGDILSESKYLSGATDLADLERRIKQVEYARSRFQHL